MSLRNVFCVMLFLITAAVMSACGGGGTSLGSHASTAAQFQSWLATVNHNDVTAATEDGLPAIPHDAGVATRTISTTEPVVKLGADHLTAYNYTDEGTAVVLQAPLEGGPGAPPVAYAVYKVEGLTGLRPTLMSVEATPTHLDDFFHVGVADYTTNHWKWFGPFTLPESEINLNGETHRFISELGNMYFCVVVHEGRGVTHNQTTLQFTSDEGNGLPAAPRDLIATDGTFTDAVGLSWLGGPDANYYEVFRALANGGNGMHGDWVRLGETVEPNYLDSTVDPGVVYLYRVRAGNQNGFSGWSNVDSGFAGEQPPPDGFRIHGWVRMGDALQGTPVPNAEITLLGLAQPLTIHTLEDGSYSFNNLPAGKFIVVPHNAALAYTPAYAVSIVGPDHPVDEKNFAARENELPLGRVYGFVYKFEGNPNGGSIFTPMAGVSVNVAVIHGEGTPVTVNTNEDGFYAAYELAAGSYLVTPAADGYVFTPAVHDVVLDGIHAAPPLFFVGSPDGGSGDMCSIEGYVNLPENGGGINDVAVSLLPPANPDGTVAYTNANGWFKFEGLAPGTYMVVPQHPHIMFTPRYVKLTLSAGMVGTCEFIGQETDANHRLWGITYTVGSGMHNGFIAMPGVTVTAHLDGGDFTTTTTSNADGYWEIVELGNGTYIVTPALEGHSFDPVHRVQAIDGTFLTPPQFFRGL